MGSRRSFIAIVCNNHEIYRRFLHDLPVQADSWKFRRVARWQDMKGIRWDDVISLGPPLTEEMFCLRCEVEAEIQIHQKETPH
jgi:hypothetical protein